MHQAVSRALRVWGGDRADMVPFLMQLKVSLGDTWWERNGWHGLGVSGGGDVRANSMATA